MRSAFSRRSPRTSAVPAAGLQAAAVRLEDVEVAFGRLIALDGLSLEVAAGERVAVIGRSGAGKTTLLRGLTRAVRVRRGRVIVDGGDLMALPLAALRQTLHRIGTIEQAHGLVPQLSAGLNVALPRVAQGSNRAALRTLARGPRPEVTRDVLEALDRVGLADRAGDRVAELSGGQQQRVAVARVLLQRPALVLADEPVASVDRVTAERVLGALDELAAEGATLLMNLHDVSFARRFPRVVALRAGRVVFDGPSERLDDEVLDRVYAGGAEAEDRRDPAPPRHEPDWICRSEAYGLRAR